MSYKYEVLSDLPFVYYPLDESAGTAAVDISTGNNGVYSSLPPLYHPTVNNSGNSKLFTTQTMTGPTLSKLWNSLRPDSPFTIEAWITPVNITTTKHVVGVGNDGIFISPQGFEFTLTGLNGPVTVYAPIDNWKINYMVTGIWDGDNLSILVNGQIVSSVLFSDVIATTAGSLTINPISSTDSYLVSNVALWDRVLLQRKVINHYLAGITNTYFEDFTRDISSYYNLTVDNAGIAFQIKENTEYDFIRSQQYDNLVYQSGRLSPNDLTLPATRVSAYNISHFGVIDGSRIDWQSNSANFTIDISLDNGVTWNSAINHSQIPGLIRNTDVSLLGLLVRQNFAAGTIDDYPYLDELKITIYSTKTIKSTDSALTATVLEPVQLAEDWTMPLLTNNAAKFTGGSMTIPAGPQIYGIEFLVRVDSVGTGLQYIVDFRPDSAGAGYLGLNGATINYFAGDTYFINGVQKVPTATDFPVGKWVHVAIKFATPISGRINISNGLVASYQTIGLYYYTPDAYRIQRHAMAAFGTGFISVSDSGFTVSEQSWNIVGPDWDVNNG